MNSKIILLVFALFFFGTAGAQQVETSNDTIVKAVPLLDSTYFKKDIFTIVQENGKFLNKINIEQTDAVRSAFNSHISAASARRKISGYRIRIFFDNDQQARVNSLAVKSNFLSVYPDIPAYWNYETPYFKVTVGDFRTKSDAMKALINIKEDFPSAFLVKQIINFPPL